MHTKIIPMLKHICLLSVVILFAACRDKGKNGDLLDEMAGREINEPYEPLFLQDTAVASFLPLISRPLRSLPIMVFSHRTIGNMSWIP